MYNNKPSNTQIRTLYAPGYSTLMMSYFRTNLTFNFVPWLSKDSTGRSEYSKTEFLSTSINHEGAAFFYMQATRILDSKSSEQQIKVVLPCNNGTTLAFEYRPDEYNQMSAYLIINKNNVTIPFRFPSAEYEEDVDGQMVTKVVQSGLGTFALILGCYLTGSAANGYFDRYGEALQMAQELAQEEWEQEQVIAVGGNNQGWN